MLIDGVGAIQDRNLKREEAGKTKQGKAGDIPRIKERGKVGQRCVLLKVFYQCMFFPRMIFFFMNECMNEYE